MVELTCQRCEHEWDYQGESDYYGTCPNCKTTVPIDGQTVPDGAFTEVAGFGAKCDYGNVVGPDAECDTTAKVKVRESGGQKWLTLIVEADLGVLGADTSISVVFDDEDIATEFGERFIEAAKQIDTEGDGTTEL